MNAAESVVERVESLGGVLAVRGERIRVRLPEDATYLIEELREHKEEVLSLLRRREDIPEMPFGVDLLRWHPKSAPVVLTRYSIVTDVPKFISTTLYELRAALAGSRWLAGNWSVPELLDRLEQCGVVVRIAEEGCANRDGK